MTKYLTSEALEKFKKELEYLEKVKRKEVSERIRQTASFGDLSENAAYDIAKEEQGFVEARIKELKEIIFQAQIIEKKESNKVEVGSFVCLESDEGEDNFQIVESEEADVFKNKISLKSPLGKAMLNKKKGDVFEVDTPEGKKKYEIVELK